MIGLYIHVPFCLNKCPYCDFYSLQYEPALVQKYVDEICRRIKTVNKCFDTIYFGGGTPSLLSEYQICKILSFVNIDKSAEITIEANPNTAFNGFNSNAGINRLSLGLQSANMCELKQLGRTHNVKDVVNAIKKARELNINNISLDLMIGLQGMSTESLVSSIEFCKRQEVNHVSAYILKIEEGTAFYKNIHELNLPDEDKVSEIYLTMVNELEARGYNQYEISNFSKKNCESRHNLKYWNCEEYLGLGPSAHSYIDGKREYFDRDINDFLNGCEPVFDSYGGDFEEYAMLRLRLTKGISAKECQNFGDMHFENLLKNAKKLPANLITYDKEHIRLSKEGFLLSNAILSNIL